MSTISVDYDVLNQKGSPAWFSDIYANIPTAGYKGRMFISIDTYAFYRDTGTGWDLIGGPGTGTITGSGTSGQVSYFNGSSTLAGSNNLFWDNTNGRLGIGTATPSAPLDIHATGTNATFNGTGTNNASLVFQNGGNSKWTIGNNYLINTNIFTLYNNTLSTAALTITSTTNALTINCNTDINTILNVKNLSVYGDATSAGVIQLKQVGSISVDSGYVGLACFTANTFGIYFPVANTSIIFNNSLLSANRIFTFPNATGTLALTSDLSSYLPLTGGTLTGALIGTSATFTGAISLIPSTFNVGSASAADGNSLTIQAANSNYFLRFKNAAGSSIGGFYYDGTNFIADSPSWKFTSNEINIGNALAATNVYLYMNGVTNKATRIVFQESGSSKWLVGNGAASENGRFEVFDNTNGTGVQLLRNTTAWVPLTSDVRLKKNFETCQGLNEVLQIEPIKYHLLFEDDNTNKKLGFKAQNLQSLIPEMVVTNGKKADDGSDYLTIVPDYLLPILVKAIQELNEKLVRNNIN